MARELLVGGTDRIAVTRLPSINLASQAYRGEAGDGSFLVDDEAAALTFPSLKVVEMTDDASGGTKYLYRGRVMSKALDGDPYVTGNSRMYAISTSDSNWDLRRLRVHNWVRPSETGRARVVALGAYILNGSSSTVTNARSRASTVINVTTYAPNTNTATMPAHTYDSTDPFAVIDDCARAEGKDFFVYQDEDGDLFLWFDQRTSSSLSSTLSITDVDPDLSTEFPPAHDGQPGMQDGTELLSGGALIDSTGAVVTEYRSGIESTYDVAEDTISDSGASGDASTRLSGFLDERDNEELRFACYVLLPAEKAHLIRAGMVISFRWADAGVTSPTDVRVARCAPELIEDDLYKMHLELSYPEKIKPRIQSHSAPKSQSSLIASCACVETFSRTESGVLGTSELNGREWQLGYDDNGPPAVSVDGSVAIFDWSALSGDRGYFVNVEGTQNSPFEMVAKLRFTGTTPGEFAGVFFLAASNGVPELFALANTYQQIWLRLFLDYNGSDTYHVKGGVGLQSEGVTGGGPSSPVILVEYPYPGTGQWFWVRVRGSGDLVQLRAWLDSDPEPTTWNVTSDPIGANDWEGTSELVDRFTIQTGGNAANDIIWEIDSINVISGLWCCTYSPASGQWFSEETLGYADGVSTTYSIPISDAYVPGTLRVWVDSLEQTSAVTETDPAAGTFTFSFVPDSTELITVSWRIA